MGFQTMADTINAPSRAAMTIDHMIQNEVRLNLSSLVSTLQEGFGITRKLGHVEPGSFNDLLEQANELCAPVDDWEEAIRQGGFRVRHDMLGFYVCSDLEAEHEDRGNPSVGFDGRGHYATIEEAYCRAAEELGIDPYQWEVYEHWAISQWLGDKLKEHGEKVDDDFAGHVVWARTCTGQGIACDGVMKKIFAEMMAPSKGGL